MIIDGAIDSISTNYRSQIYHTFTGLIFKYLMHYEAQSKMKKYYQLLLVVVSLLSVTALIFYRHEYHRLRYVLEVLNFFGDPGQKSKDVDRNCLSLDRKPYPSINKHPSWQRVTDSLHVYSAFWDSDARHVKAIAVSSASESLDLLTCYLWFSDIAEPKKGRVNAKAENLQGTGFLYLYCKPSDAETGEPHSTSFNSEKESSAGTTIPVLQSYHSRNSQNISVHVCTIPGFVTNSEAIGYLAYHQLIGVTSFIVYGQPQFQGVNIINVPWNFPFPSKTLINPAIEADCVLRAGAAGASYAITLSWNEYIVPRYHRSLQTLFTEYSGSEKGMSFEIVRSDFCTEFNDSQKTFTNYKMLPMQKTHRRAEKTQKLLTVHAVSSTINKVQKITDSIISLHQYVLCYKNNRFRKGRVIYDPIFRRFDPDLQEALKFWSAMVKA